MNSRKPPRMATWLLERSGTARRNPALVGDLLEEFRAGRSDAWFWRQTAIGILTSFGASRNELSAARDYLKTGIPQLGLGLIFLACGSLFTPLIVDQSERFFPKGSMFSIAVFATSLVLAVVSFRAIPRLIRKLRETVVLPRAGRMEWPEPKSPAFGRRVTIFVLLMLSAILFSLMFRRGVAIGGDSVRGVVLAAVEGACLLWIAIRYRMLSMLGQAIFVLALGAFIYRMGPIRDSASWVLIGSGIALAAEGLWRLKRFVDKHPKPAG